MDRDALQRLKRYMRVDHDDDDDLICRLWESSVEYLKNAGIDESSDPGLYWLAAAGLTLYWYDSNPFDSGTLESIPLGIRRVINQLKAKCGGLNYV